MRLSFDKYEYQRDAPCSERKSNLFKFREIICIHKELWQPITFFNTVEELKSYILNLSKVSELQYCPTGDITIQVSYYGYDHGNKWDDDTYLVSAHIGGGCFINLGFCDNAFHQSDNMKGRVYEFKCPRIGARKSKIQYTPTGVEKKVLDLNDSSNPLSRLKFRVVAGFLSASLPDVIYFDSPSELKCYLESLDNLKLLKPSSGETLSIRFEYAGYDDRPYWDDELFIVKVYKDNDHIGTLGYCNASFLTSEYTSNGINVSSYNSSQSSDKNDFNQADVYKIPKEVMACFETVNYAEASKK
jgi:hypothetical protein